MTGHAFPHYPVFLDIHGLRCLVVGGGPVAYRKAKTLLEHGAAVTVVSPDLCPEMKNLARDTNVRAVLGEYDAGNLRGVFLAIAATDDARVNRRVAAEARERAVLVNVVDDLESSGFIAPSYLRRGDVTIAISTGGASPALARRIRIKLEAEFGPEYAPLASLLHQIRTELKGEEVTVTGDAWQEALDLEPLLELLRARRVDEARNMVLEGLGVASEPERG